MAASISKAEEGNADHVWLGVWERNPRAIAFYKKLGFSEVGDHVFVLGTDPQRDIIMIRELWPDEHPSPQ
jgi:ribosomal protein S18 acetylase RimI-like enzyme